MIATAGAALLLAGPGAIFHASAAEGPSELELELENTPPQAPKKSSQSEKSKSPVAEPTKNSARPTASEARGNEIDAKIDQAQKLYDAKKYKDAIAVLRPLNDKLPRAGLLLLARSYSANGEVLDEIRTLDLCLAKNPKDYVVKTVYGQALIREKRFEDGIAAFQEARQLNPRYKPAYEVMVKELEQKGERYEARNVLNDMIKVFGPQAEFYTSLCRLYAADNYNEKSVEICGEAINKDSHIPENHVYLGLALMDREELDRATKVLTHAATRFPRSEPVQSAMGSLYFTKKDIVRSFKYYKAATSADPKSARAWVGYATAALNLQKNEEALDGYVKACKLDRMTTKEFRLALIELRKRHDNIWRSKFENAIGNCQ